MKTEKRKAKVGERILIVDDSISLGKYKVGDILTVEKSIPETPGVLGGVFAQGIDVSILDGEYEVIVDETEADNVENVNFSEMSLGELEEFVQKAVKALSKRAFHAGFRDGREAQRKSDGNLDDMIDNAMKKAERWLEQQRRDEIIEKAKREVEEIRNDPIQTEGLLATFVVDREKRMVTALLSSVLTGVVERQGVAKCHPDDCFNIHLGKIIALYKALGLEVPDEYLNVPQPTEVRVGDTVKYRNAQRLKTVVTDETPTPLSSDNTRISHARLSVEQFGARIIDDSREGVTE